MSDKTLIDTIIENFVNRVKASKEPVNEVAAELPPPEMHQPAPTRAGAMQKVGSRFYAGKRFSSGSTSATGRFGGRVGASSMRASANQPAASAPKTPTGRSLVPVSQNKLPATTGSSATPTPKTPTGRSLVPVSGGGTSVAKTTGTSLTTTTPSASATPKENLPTKYGFQAHPVGGGGAAVRGASLLGKVARAAGGIEGAAVMAAAPPLGAAMKKGYEAGHKSMIPHAETPGVSMAASMEKMKQMKAPESAKPATITTAPLPPKRPADLGVKPSTSAEKPVSAVKTKGGDFPVYKSGGEASKSFQSAYKTATPGTEFKWKAPSETGAERSYKAAPEFPKTSTATPTPPTKPAELKTSTEDGGKKKKMSEETTNSLIASFLKLQETKAGNMFEAAKKAKKDYDKDGKVESEKDEVWGSRFRAAKAAGKMEEGILDPKDPSVQGSGDVTSSSPKHVRPTNPERIKNFKDPKDPSVQGSGDVTVGGKPARVKEDMDLAQVKKGSEGHPGVYHYGVDTKSTFERMKSGVKATDPHATEIKKKVSEDVEYINEIGDTDKGQERLKKYISTAKAKRSEQHKEADTEREQKGGAYWRKHKEHKKLGRLNNPIHQQKLHKMRDEYDKSFKKERTAAKKLAGTDERISKAGSKIKAHEGFEFSSAELEHLNRIMEAGVSPEPAEENMDNSPSTKLERKTLTDSKKVK